MPSAIAHGLVGAGLAALGPPATRRAPVVALLAVVAMLPDLDVLGLRLGIPYGHPLGHRGLSHSLPFALALGLAVWLAAGPASGLGAGSGARRPARARVAIGGLAALACASHGLLDACTDAGLGVGFFVPFHDGRTFFSFRPLATSPLSLGRFFGPAGLRILANEALWIGLPGLLGLAIVLGWRRRRASGSKASGSDGAG